MTWIIGIVIGWTLLMVPLFIIEIVKNSRRRAKKYGTLTIGQEFQNMLEWWLPSKIKEATHVRKTQKK